MCISISTSLNNVLLLTSDKQHLELREKADKFIK